VTFYIVVTASPSLLTKPSSVILFVANLKKPSKRVSSGTDGTDLVSDSAAPAASSSPSFVFFVDFA